jgi:lysophospholipase L1-like esterase
VRRFLALGDSYTIGEGVLPDERWPTQLVRLIRKQSIKIAEPEIVARTAWTTDELSDAIDSAQPRGPFDLVTLLIGVNDQYRSRPPESLDEFYRPLLRRAIEFANGRPERTIAISIPDWGATPFAEGRDRALIKREVEAYNARERDIAAAEGTTWVDVTEISRQMTVEPALVTADGLHPTGDMYKRWAERILPVALTALA